MPMPALQEVIHKIELGEWTRYVKVGVALLGFLVFAVVYDVRQFKNFGTVEAMDQAQLARNVANGEGFTTDFIRPLSVYLLQKQQAGTGTATPGRFLREAHPDTSNPPVYPLILAGWMKLLPFQFEIQEGAVFWRHQPEVLIAILNQLFFFAAVFLVFRLALKLFDTPVAWITAVIFFATDLFWKFSVSGLSTMFLVLLVVTLAWCLVVLEERHRLETATRRTYVLLALAIGAVLGIGMLTRYAFGWLAVPVILFYVLYLGRQQATTSLVTLGLAAAIVAPWLVRNAVLTGAPFGTASYAIYQETAPQFTGNKLERYVSSEFDVAMEKVGVNAFVRKLVVNASEIVRTQLLNLGGNWVSAFFIVGLMVPFLNPGLNRLRVFLLLSILVLIVVEALGRGHMTADAPEINSEKLLVLVAPLAFVFGVAMFYLLLDQINLPFPPTRTLVATGFGLIVCAPLIFTMLPPRTTPIAYPPYWPPMVHDVARWMEPEELMMSDMPWAVAWYGDRKCLWTTLDAPRDVRNVKQSDFLDIHDYQKPIQGILLTRVTTDAKWFSQMIQGQDFAWGKFMLECLLRTNVPTGFPLKYSPPGFLQHGLLFLSDRNRWEVSDYERRVMRIQQPKRED